MFNFFNKKPKIFIDEEKHLANLDRQLIMTPQTVKQLRQHGVDEVKTMKLEYFFYTNTIEKAKALNEVLNTMGYSSEYGESAGDKKLFIVNGWTAPIQMSHNDLVEWTGEMCVVGHRADCEFDGWGTRLDQ